jgi:hypothetical protein
VRIFIRNYLKYNCIDVMAALQGTRFLMLHSSVGSLNRDTSLPFLCLFVASIYMQSTSQTCYF